MATNSPSGLNKKSSFVLLLTVLLLCPLVSSAQDRRYGSVSGTVIDFATKAPIENTIIVHLGSRLRAKTDSKGRFGIDRVPTGICYFEISHDGYPTIRYKGFEVVADSDLVLHITLPKFPNAGHQMPTFVPDSTINYKMRFLNPEEKVLKPERDSSKVEKKPPWKMD